MSLAARRRAVAAAEARLASTSAQLGRSWAGLKQEGAAALTPGRVVVAGLLSGFFGGALATSWSASRAAPTGAAASPLLPELLRLAQLILPLFLPELAAAFRAGASAAGEAAEPAATAADGP